jgi:excisionase family DNA binding protein
MHTKPLNRLAYSISQAVEATSIGRSLLYKQIKAGNLKTFKIGTRTLIAAEDLVAWLNKSKQRVVMTPDPNEGKNQ